MEGGGRRPPPFALSGPFGRMTELHDFCIALFRIDLWRHNEGAAATVRMAIDGWRRGVGV